MSVLYNDTKMLHKSNSETKYTYILLSNISAVKYILNYIGAFILLHLHTEMKLKITL